MARWNPNTRPRAAASTPSTSNASRGAPRTPLPSRSTTRPASTPGQAPATAMIAFPSAAIPYPVAINGRLANRSPSGPTATLVMDAAPSAAPSMAPTTDGGAPSTAVR